MIARLACIMAVLMVTAAVPAAADTTSVTPDATLDCRDPIGGFVHLPTEDYEGFDQALLRPRREHDP